MQRPYYWKHSQQQLAQGAAVSLGAGPFLATLDTQKIFPAEKALPGLQKLCSGTISSSPGGSQARDISAGFPISPVCRPGPRPPFARRVSGPRSSSTARAGGSAAWMCLFSGWWLGTASGCISVIYLFIFPPRQRSASFGSEEHMVKHAGEYREMCL